MGRKKSPAPDLKIRMPGQTLSEEAALIRKAKALIEEADRKYGIGESSARELAEVVRGLEVQGLLPPDEPILTKENAEPKESMVRITAILPASLYQRLGYAAVDERKPATELVRVALTEYLNRRDKVKGDPQ